MADSSKLIQISRGRERTTFWRRLEDGPLADKFFALAIVSGILGITYLGVHLWLVRTSQIPVYIQYQEMRRLHALLQMDLFLSPFLLGFLFQAGPKLMGSSYVPPRALLALLPLMVCGVLVGTFLPDSWLGGIRAIAPLTGLYILLRICTGCSTELVHSRGFLFGIGLCGLVGGAFADIQDPTIGLVVFWIGVGAMIFASSQQFIVGFFEGRGLSGFWCPTFNSAFLLSCFLGLWMVWHPSMSWVFGTGALLCIALFIVGTKSSRIVQQTNQPLALAFVVSYFWAFVASAQLALSLQGVDSIFHLFAIGWATTLILAVTPRIVSVLSSSECLSDRSLFFLVMVWQLVPLGRAFGQLLPGWFSWIVACAASGVFLIWGYKVIRRISQLVARQCRAES